jgi:ubiquinone/menaquinone biosynthesis C-methylase UbiE
MSDRTISDQWNASADGWARWAARAVDYLVPATETMLDLGAVTPGSHVLDVGCGSGEQTVLAARRVGEAGQVLAIDIAAPMIAATETTVAAAGLTNVSTHVCTAEALVGTAGPFDAAFSRLVLMLIPDPISTARAVHAMLRPGGRFVALVPGDRAKTGFSAIALDILARHGGKTNWEDRPGSIRSLVEPDRLAGVLRDAGFSDITVSTAQTVMRMESAAAMTRMIRDAYAFYKALIADIPTDRQEAAWTEVEQALTRFQGPDGFAGPSEMNIVVGRKPTR